MPALKMPSKPKLIVAAALVLTAGVGITTGVALANHGSGDKSPPQATAKVSNEAPMDHAMENMTEPTGAQPAAAGTGDAVFLAAELSGKNEVPANDGKKVGDPDGRAVEVLRIKGNTVSFAVTWKGIGAPVASHIHEGAEGANGAVKVPFFGTALPDTVSAATGSVTVDDPAVLDGLKNSPEKFYANLHTAEFGGGAVRAQLKKLDKPVDLQRVLHFGALTSIADGGQEVPSAEGKPTADPDGQASAFLWANGTRIDYSFNWSGIDGPTLGHLHQGAFGTNGAVVAPLFSAPTGLPESINGIAGTAANIDAKVIENLTANPGDFYTNLHTAKLSGGAVRGQVFRAGSPA
jgi:hypothetical protein